ncbi:MAG: hypothetical protein LRS46_02455 [Desulfurococcales archaeon]|nr:hypothetical protein [Desulfurococcales archaeon]
MLNAPSVLREGVVYEFIAWPCGYRYTTPLGLRWGKPPTARVYSSTRLYGILRSGGVEKLLLYSPVDPEDFIDSILHTLEEELDQRACRPPRPFTVAVECRPVIASEGPGYIDIECPGTVESGVAVPYTRLYGGIVEALVVASKEGAGVVGREFAEACLQCALYSAERGGRSRALELSDKLQAAIKRLRGAKGLS